MGQNVGYKHFARQFPVFQMPRAFDDRKTHGGYNHLRAAGLKDNDVADSNFIAHSVPFRRNTDRYAYSIVPSGLTRTFMSPLHS